MYGFRNWVMASGIQSNLEDRENLTDEGQAAVVVHFLWSSSQLPWLFFLKLETKPVGESEWLTVVSQGSIYFNIFFWWNFILLDEIRLQNTHSILDTSETDTLNMHFKNIFLFSPLVFSVVFFWVGGGAIKSILTSERCVDKTLQSLFVCLKFC